MSSGGYRTVWCHLYHLKQRLSDWTGENATDQEPSLADSDWNTGTECMERQWTMNQNINATSIIELPVTLWRTSDNRRMPSPQAMAKTWPTRFNNCFLQEQITSTILIIGNKEKELDYTKVWVSWMKILLSLPPSLQFVPRQHLIWSLTDPVQPPMASLLLLSSQLLSVLHFPLEPPWHHIPPHL